MLHFVSVVNMLPKLNVEHASAVPSCALVLMVAIEKSTQDWSLSIVAVVQACCSFFRAETGRASE